MHAELALPSFAKINLNLKVLGKREDGFHEIFTVFQTVSLKDDISFCKSEDISIVCEQPGIPTGESNLIYKAILALQEYSGRSVGARIELIKRIPSPGGLGGGSSNAATALVGVSKLWNLDIPLAALIGIGADIGSDVPFFLFGGTAIGTGRGTSVETVRDAPQKHGIIVSPHVSVSTEEAYSKLGKSHLTKNESKSILEHYREGARALYSGQFEYENDFQTVAFEDYKEIENAAVCLRDLSASVVALSGTGPSIFGFFEDHIIRDKALAFLRENSTVRSFPVEFVSGREYQKEMGLVSS